MEMYDHIDDDVMEAEGMAEQGVSGAYEVDSIANKVNEIRNSTNKQSAAQEPEAGSDGGSESANADPEAPNAENNGETQQAFSDGANSGAGASGTEAGAVGDEGVIAGAAKAHSQYSQASAQMSSAAGGTTSSSENLAIAGTVAQHGSAAGNATAQGSATAAATAQQGSAAVASASTAASSGTAATGTAVGTAAAAGPYGVVAAAVIALLSSKKVRNGIMAVLIFIAFASTLVIMTMFRYGSGLVVELLEDSDELTLTDNYLKAEDELEEGIRKAFLKTKEKIRKEARRGGYDEGLTMANINLDKAQYVEWDPFLLISVYSTVNEQTNLKPSQLRKKLENADLFPYTSTVRTKMVTDPYKAPKASLEYSSDPDKIYDEQMTFHVPRTDLFGVPVKDEYGNQIVDEVVLGTPVEKRYLDVDVLEFDMDAACAALGMSLKSAEADALYQPETTVFDKADRDKIDFVEVYEALYGEDGILSQSSNDTYLQHILDMAEETEVLVYGTINGHDVTTYGVGNHSEAIITDQGELDSLKASLTAVRNLIDSIQPDDFSPDFDALQADPEFDFTTYQAPITSEAKSEWLEKLDESISRANSWRAGRNISSRHYVEAQDTIERLRSTAQSFQYTDEQRTQLLQITRECELSFRSACTSAGLNLSEEDGVSSIYEYGEDGYANYDPSTGMPLVNSEAYDQMIESINASGDSSGIRARIVAEAYKRINIPYNRGWRSDGIGLDCSGLVQKVYETALPDIGSALARTSQGQYSWAKDVQVSFTDESNLQPGDLIFFAKWDASEGDWVEPNRADHITHVSIYVGNGKEVHATPTYSCERRLQDKKRKHKNGDISYIVGYASPVAYYLKKNGLSDSGSIGENIRETSVSMKEKDKYHVLTDYDYIPDTPFTHKEMQILKYDERLIVSEWGDDAPESILVDGKPRALGTAAMSKSMIISILGKTEAEGDNSADPLGTVIEIDGILYKVREYTESQYKHDPDIVYLYEPDHDEVLKWNYQEQGLTGALISSNRRATVKFYRYNQDTSGESFDAVRRFT